MICLGVWRLIVVFFVVLFYSYLVKKIKFEFGSILLK